MQQKYLRSLPDCIVQFFGVLRLLIASVAIVSRSRQQLSLLGSFVAMVLLRVPLILVVSEPVLALFQFT